MTIVDPGKLLETLIAQPRETEWLEFKISQFDPEDTGRYIAGLANAAMLHDQEHGYLVFGVEDGTHKVVGTTVRLKDAKGAGNEPFEPWAARLLHPCITFEIAPFEYDGKHVEIVRIQPAYLMPVRFKNDEYIRVDSMLKPLRDYPERARALWAITSRYAFERSVVAANLDAQAVFTLFDPDQLFQRLGAPKLAPAAAMERLVGEGLLVDNMQGGYDATNLLAILAARDITAFPSLAKKVARVAQYKGESKTTGIDERAGKMGYALGFNSLLKYIMNRIEHKEEMLHGTRITVYAIPEISVREFIANALIHQDLTSQGDGPFVEIFSDRVRITNPGKPLMAADRLINTPPKSRNELLAKFMNRLGFFEGRGSGVDRAIEAIEKEAITSPLLTVFEDSMVVTLFKARTFGMMTKEDRIRGCYQHACLRYEAGLALSNESLRNRFGLTAAQASTASQVINDTKEAGKIKPRDEEQANRVARYLPYWA